MKKIVVVSLSAVMLLIAIQTKAQSSASQHKPAETKREVPRQDEILTWKDMIVVPRKDIAMSYEVIKLDRKHILELSEADLTLAFVAARSQIFSKPVGPEITMK